MKRMETAQKLDSLRYFQEKLDQLKAKSLQVESLEVFLYQELSRVPKPSDSLRPGVSTSGPVKPSLREETLQAQLTRVQGLLNRIGQQEEIIHRVARRTAYLPRHRPIESIEIAVGFGWAYHPITNQLYEHKGVDFLIGPGTPVWATADGIVREVVLLPGTDKAYKVCIQHSPSLQTVYYPVEPIVHPGQHISGRTRLGYVTRFPLARISFLHYEVWKNDQPTDPLPYLWGDFPVAEVARLQEAFRYPANGLH